MSLVTSFAPLASVRAMISVGTPQHIGRQTRRDEIADGMLGRDEHLAAHVAALLLAGELVFEVHARGAGFDHGLHQLVHLSAPPNPASASATIGANQWTSRLAFAGLNLVGALEARC